MMRSICALGLLLLTSSAWPQVTTPAPSLNAAPKVLLLVYQQFITGKASQRQELEIDIARNFDRLAVPVSWIGLEALTGPAQSLFLDPASSFAEIDKAGSALAQIYGSQPDLAQSQQRIEDLIASSRTVTAFRRDDLSANPDALNLAKARYLRIRTVQVPPGRERDFVNAVGGNLQQHSAVTAWAAYQVNAGFPDLTFLFVEPLRSMQGLDEGLSRVGLELSQLGPASSSETNLYAIHPEMSHVSREFAAIDPSFWMPAPKP